MRRRRAPILQTGWFQSAPGREAGRCISPWSFPVSRNLFQSAPGREAGRCPAYCLRMPAANSFNPRPAVRPGDAKTYAAATGQEPVSIRARP